MFVESVQSQRHWNEKKIFKGSNAFEAQPNILLIIHKNDLNSLFSAMKLNYLFVELQFV